MIVMKDGVVVKTGSTDQVFVAPIHEYIKALLAAVPHLGAAPVRDTKIATNVQPALRLENLDIAYPKRGKVPAFLAVKNTSLEISPGSF